MITRTPAEVKERFGQLFSKKFLVIVDSALGTAEIIEQCRARGPVEWDAMNRRRAGGATTACSVEGSTLTLKARIGTYPVQFGPSDAEIGGQALEGVEVRGDEVITTWKGIAGAGVGVAACLAQAPGVTRAEYPSEEDLVTGGARTNRVRIVSPVYEKVTIGVDDTDTKETGATWVTALRCAETCNVPGTEFLSMRLVQLNPAVPKKTTNCVGTVLSFAARPSSVLPLVEAIRDGVQSASVSGDTGIVVMRGLAVPDHPLKRRIKTEIVTYREALAAAAEIGAEFVDENEKKGRIGALGALLWAHDGAEAAGLYGEHL